MPTRNRRLRAIKAIIVRNDTKDLVRLGGEPARLTPITVWCPALGIANASWFHDLTDTDLPVTITLPEHGIRGRKHDRWPFDPRQSVRTLPRWDCHVAEQGLSGAPGPPNDDPSTALRYSDPWASTEMGCHSFHIASRDS
jgi:hypothetical protein